MKRPFIECPKCDGVGTIEMGDELFDTLQVVKTSGQITANGVCDKLGFPHNATLVNNRLEDLRKLGLIEREKDPSNLKANVYFLKRKAA